MKLKRKIIVGYIILSINVIFYAFSYVEAAGDSKIGITTALFLNIAQGARPAGLGGAFVAVADDVNACWWNPAGLIQLSKKEMMAVHTRWIEDIEGNFIAYAQLTTPYEGRQRAIGGSVILINVSNIDGRDAQGNKTTILDVENRAVAFSTALGLSPYTSVGITLKAISQNLGGYKGEVMGIDIGWLYSPTDKFSLGANLQNIAPKMKIENVSNYMPLNLKLGFRFTPTILGENVLAAFDVDVHRDNRIGVHAGIEYWASNAVCIRLGCEKPSKTRTGYSIGVGVKGSGEGMFKGIHAQIDYAMLSYNNFEPTHRISVITRF